MPSGAKKITASGGYIPNFVETGSRSKVSSKTVGEGPIVTAKIPSPKGAVMLLPSQEEAARVNSNLIYNTTGVRVKDPSLRKQASGVKFTAFGFQGSRVKNIAKNAEVGEVGLINSIIPRIQNAINQEGANIVNQFKPLTKTPIDTAEFSKLYSEKSGATGAASSVAGSIFEAAIDYSLNAKKSRAAKAAIASAEGVTFDVLNFRQARVLRDAFGATGANYKGEQFADYKISAERAQTFADQVVRNKAFAIEGKAANGFVPNFAAGPLGDAIGREMAAGVSPSKIRVTQDGRLRNSQNPNGLAVINTRDEPNGKIPNYAAIPRAGYERTTASGDVSSLPKTFEKRLRDAINAQIKSLETGAVDQNKVNEQVQKLATQYKLTSESQKKLEQRVATAASSIPARTTTINPTMAQWMSAGAAASAAPTPTGQQPVTAPNKADKPQPDILKSVLIFSALNTAMSVFQSTLGDANTGLGRLVNATASAATQFGTGSILGSSIAQASQGTRFEGLGGLVGRASPYAFLAASVFDSLNQEFVQRPRAQATERAQGIVQNISESSISGEDTLAQFKASRDAAIERRKGLSVPNTFFTKAAETALQAGPLSAIARTETGAALTDFLTKSKEQREAQQKILDADKEIEALKKAVGEQERKNNNELAKGVKLEEQQKQEVARRLSLSKSLDEILLGFLQRQNQNLLDRAKIVAEDVRNASLLNATEKENLTLIRKREEFAAKASDAQEGFLKSAIQELESKSALVSLGEKEKNLLIEKLKTGQDVADGESIIADLGLKNANALNEVLKLYRQRVRESNLTIDNEGKIFELLFKSNNEEQKRLLLIKTQNDALNEQYNIAENLKQIRKESVARDEQQAANLDIERLRARVAARNTGATPTEQLELDTKEKALALSKQQFDIDSKYDESRRTALNNLKQRYNQIIGSEAALQFVNPEQIEVLQKAITLGETAEDLQDSFTSIVGQNANALDEDALAILQENLNVLESATEQYKENVTQSEKAKTNEEAILEIRKSIVTVEERIARTRAQSRVTAGILKAQVDLEKEAEGFTENLANQTTFAFRDGLSEALKAAISQTDDLGDALQNVARNFLQTLQGQFLQNAATQATLGVTKLFTGAKGGIVKKYAGGGPVIGGSGYKDDVPAMLTGGEFVMRKSAVQKYGMENLAKMNDGGIFLPGVRGGRDIVGYGDLTRFAKQTTTSGATDVMRGGASSAFIDLEDQSARLSRFGLLNDDTINQEIRSAQEQALGIIREREQYRTQQRKAFQQQLFSTVAAAALNFGVKSLMGGAKTSQPPSTIKSGGVGLASAQNFKNTLGTSASGPMAFGKFTSSIVKGVPYKAYGGLMPRYAAGGPTDDIPALLMGGEYVMSRQSTRKYGKQFFDAINQGRAPRFANGGMVSTETDTSLGDKFDNLSSKLETTAGSNISININVTSGGATETQTQGETTRGGIDYKKMGDQIRQVVIQTINEEKRLGGSLRSR